MKTHLLDSPIPLIEGSKQVAICGAVVPNAKFVAQSSEDLTPESVFLMASCYRCQKKASSMEHKYLYAICDGESVLNPEAEVYLEEVKNER